MNKPINFLFNILAGMIYYFLACGVKDRYGIGWGITSWFICVGVSVCVHLLCNSCVLKQHQKIKRKKLNSFYGIDNFPKLESFTNPYDAKNPWEGYDGALVSFDKERAKRIFEKTKELMEK